MGFRGFKTFFLLWCPGYDEIRIKSILLQRPYIENEEYIIGQLLLNELIQETKDLVYERWKKREKQRKDLLDAAAA